MQTSPTAIFWRHDTFLGVCEAMGQDFGFNPNWLRLMFAVALLPSPAGALGVYLALGVVVAISRFAFPPHGLTDNVALDAMTTPAADNDETPVDLAAAA